MNPSGIGICGVCLLPQDVRKVIDAALSESPRTKSLRDLQAESGISRATLSRHWRNHVVRDVVRAFRDKKKHASLAGKGVVVEWPKLPHYPHRYTVGAHPISANELRSDDLLIRVKIESLPPRNPPPLEKIVLQPPDLQQGPS